MVWLEVESIEETPKKGAGRETKAALEVRVEDHALTGFQSRLCLFAGTSASYSLRDPACPDQPVYLRLGDFGALPASAVAAVGGYLGGVRDVAGRHIVMSGENRKPRARGKSKDLQNTRKRMKIGRMFR